MGDLSGSWVGPIDMSRTATIVILAWNRWDLTRACLDSLLATDLRDAEVLVVNNGSTDETSRALRAYPSIRVLSLADNVGFVRGNNAGIQSVPADHDVILVNNDVVFNQTDWLACLRTCAARHPDAGVLGCRLVLPDGRLLHAGTYILPDTMAGQQIGSLEHDIGQYGTDREVEGIVFALAYLRREVLDRIGGLNEAFVSYFEDTDYCLRAALSGFKTVVCGDVTLVHDEHGSTRDGDASLDQMLAVSRREFSSLWRDHLEARYHHRLLWQSILNFPTGYAMSSRQQLIALDRAGVRMVYRYVYGPQTSFPVEEPEGLPDYRLNVFRGRRLTRRDRAVSVVYGQADVFHRNLARYKIGYTMLEVDGFPAEWVRQANTMNEVWVPSEFNRRGMLESGVRRPIHVMPLGVDTDHFSPAIRGVPEPTGDFVFLASFEWGERKDPWALLRCFNDEFGADEPVRLVCKVMNRDPEVSLRHEIRKLRLRSSGGRIGFLFNCDFPYEQLGALYRSADCYIASGRGEGWDMPLMEAMACGLPSIATDWGGHEQFVHDGISYPLRVRGLIPAQAKCPYYAGFKWADPDVDHLRHLLRHVFDHQDEARSKGEQAADEMAALWTWDHAAERIRERLESIG